MLQPDTALMGGKDRGRIGGAWAWREHRATGNGEAAREGQARRRATARARGGHYRAAEVKGRRRACWPPNHKRRRPASRPPTRNEKQPDNAPPSPRREHRATEPDRDETTEPGATARNAQPYAPPSFPYLPPNQGGIGLEQCAFPPPKRPSSVKKA